VLLQEAAVLGQAEGVGEAVVGDTAARKDEIGGRPSAGAELHRFWLGTLTYDQNKARNAWIRFTKEWTNDLP